MLCISLFLFFFILFAEIHQLPNMNGEWAFQIPLKNIVVEENILSSIKKIIFALMRSQNQMLTLCSQYLPLALIQNIRYIYCNMICDISIPRIMKLQQLNLEITWYTKRPYMFSFITFITATLYV